MNSRRLICFLLGVWFAGTLGMSVLTSCNVSRVTRSLDTVPGKGALITRTIGRDSAWYLLRYHSSELNRFYIGNWDKVQLALGVMLFLLLLFTTSAGWLPLAAILAVIVLTAGQHWLLTVRILEHGRALDFLPPAVITNDRNALEALERLDRWAGWTKLVLLGGLSLRFLFSHGGRRRRGVAGDVDMIDDADHAHIDR